MGGFQKFLMRGNVVDLAVAVIIGAAFGAVVTSLVKNIITPIIGIFGGLPDFSAWAITVGQSKFMIGDFINDVLAFIVIALVIYYFVVVPMNRVVDRMKKDEPEPAKTKTCPECAMDIPLAAKRCGHCTAVLSGAAA